MPSGPAFASGAVSFTANPERTHPIATAAQIHANQANARRSTGPRTAEGKAASARNSTSHGLCSKDFVILQGEELEFADFMANLEAALQPVGAVELDLFTQHAHASWGLRRCRRAEVASQGESGSNGDDPLLNYIMADRLKRIDLYARRTERTYSRTLKELQALQTIRLSAEIIDPLEAAIHPPPQPSVLVNPIQLNRQRAAVARAQSASDETCDKVVVRNSVISMKNACAAAVAEELNERTQSQRSSTLAAGRS